ncbi:hypothetical protein ACTI_07160 [Actinoplanes sp. OR16]|nr:hypothetical protein ACTI_07160 [Actinoplanes sp. OR16]
MVTLPPGVRLVAPRGTNPSVRATRMTTSSALSSSVVFRVTTLEPSTTEPSAHRGSEIREADGDGGEVAGDGDSTAGAAGTPDGDFGDAGDGAVLDDADGVPAADGEAAALGTAALGTAALGTGAGGASLFPARAQFATPPAAKRATTAAAADAIRTREPWRRRVTGSRVVDMAIRLSIASRSG